MQRFRSEVLTLLAASAVLVGSAQQTPAAGTTPTPKPHSSTGTAARHSSAAARPKPLPLTTDKQKQSYAIGLSFGKNLHRDAIDVDPRIVMQGLQDALADGKAQLTDEQVRTVMTGLQTQVRQKQEAKRLAEVEVNKKQSATFLAANATKQGVVTLPSGLQYKVLTAGTGPKPTATDSVVCNYSGKLLDGTEFDSSYKRGEPATFPVSGVIKGWTEALQLMPTGSKWQLFIPADLAYGEHGQGPIGPNATLVFEVELMSIAPAAPATPATPTTPPTPKTP